jgi:hypothetical protein
MVKQSWLESKTLKGSWGFAPTSFVLLKSLFFLHIGFATVKA